jgi:hypothetical protein
VSCRAVLCSCVAFGAPLSTLLVQDPYKGLGFRRAPPGSRVRWKEFCFACYVVTHRYSQEVHLLLHARCALSCASASSSTRRAVALSLQLRDHTFGMVQPQLDYVLDCIQCRQYATYQCLVCDHNFCYGCFRSYHNRYAASVVWCTRNASRRGVGFVQSCVMQRHVQAPPTRHLRGSKCRLWPLLSTRCGPHVLHVP